MISANSCPLALEVFDLDGKPCGFATYLKRIGDHVYYQHDGKTYTLTLGIFKNAKTQIGMVVAK